MGEYGDHFRSIDSSPHDDTINDDEILNSLKRILNHPTFRSSPQLTAFFDYVVSEEIAGRGDKIKAYTVAVDALGREESFDPSSDAVIRVVANRLRQTLERVYLEMGDQVPIRINMVKGSYRPVFVRNAVSASANDNLPLPPKPVERHANQAIEHARRYQLIITFLLVMLAVMIAYVVWDLGLDAAGNSGGISATFVRSVSL